VTALADLVVRRIRATGPLTVAELMTAALQHPRLGYYATRDPLGAAGDFVTAPEVSQVFGELVGLWCADVWARMGRPDPVLLVELGPGRGTLMADALRALGVAPDFRRALRLHLVETSPALRGLQARTLAGAQPVWHESLDQAPEGPLLLIANEFLDALPIRQFERRGGAWHERRVGIAADGAALAFLLDPAPSASATQVPPRLASSPDGSVVEVSPAAIGLASDVARRLAAGGGAALFVDYGHVESACGDTLQAVLQHRYHPVLEALGSADLTAHVDFQALADVARASGARACGPVTQGDFLRSLGIEVRARQLLAKASPETSVTIESGVRRLIGDREMGTLFKVLALTHPNLPTPAGFPRAHHDHA
jgi:NADH dehydrogenase [ubiquinone] 1 alpha subcomplex assembly factor 7